MGQLFPGNTLPKVLTRSQYLKILILKNHFKNFGTLTLAQMMTKPYLQMAKLRGPQFH